MNFLDRFKRKPPPEPVSQEVTHVFVNNEPIEIFETPCPVNFATEHAPGTPAPDALSLQLRMDQFQGYFAGSRFIEFTPPVIDAAKLEALKAVEPHQATKRQPDYVHVLTGWRAWDVVRKNKGPRLEALGGNTRWKPKKQLTAECMPGLTFGDTSPHESPGFNCKCGVWAFKDLDTLVAALRERSNVIKVLGTVSLWGRVIETENGWRAQHAYPSELWLFDNSLEELGYIYDVPVRTL